MVILNLLRSDIKMDKIPFIIHQMWLDVDTETNTVPCKKYVTEHYTLSIKKLNPNFAYIFWNMEKVRELFEDPRLQRWKRFYFQALREHIEMCDFARYAIMYIHGGVYIDCDFTAVKSLDTLIESHAELLLTLDVRAWGSQVREPGMTGPAAIFNGFLGSKPGHYFWSELMDSIMYRYNKDVPVLNTTGPVAVGEFAQRMYYSIDDCPQWYIDNKLVNWRKIEGPNTELQYLHSNHFDGTNWWMTGSMIHKFTTNYVQRSMNLTTALIVMAIILIIIIIIYCPELAISNEVESRIRQLWQIKMSSSSLWLSIGLTIVCLRFLTSYWALISSAKDPRHIPKWESISRSGMYIGVWGVIVVLRSIRSFLLRQWV
jgi:hypothetical protein